MSSNKLNNPVIILFWSTPSITMLKMYKKKSDLLSQAVGECRAVKVFTDCGKMIQFTKLKMEAGKFFGLESLKGNMRKLLLNIHHIKSIELL